MGKAVIFIGGSSYSGSTFLDMVLANSPYGFSCGEVNALFYPYRKHHINHECGCGNQDCDIWQNVKEKGESNIYQTIFEMFPEITYIVDSSKDPVWIHDRTAELNNSKIDVRNILLWKTPEEFYVSRKKRKREKGWKRAWANYYRLYFRMIGQWDAVKYSVLVEKPEVLEALCETVGIEYFDGKELYWKKKHHTLFGNTSAKIHLYDSGSEKYENCIDELSKTINSAHANSSISDHHKKVHYRQPLSDEVKKEELFIDRILKEIRYLLEATDILAGNGNKENLVKSRLAPLQASAILPIYHRIKRSLLVFGVKKYYLFRWYDRSCRS